ncbi:SDR family oxidoreductase [Seongchinamella unica]|uniref:SDR family oxidoreductase n=1 Tax=Seongchinamella unica TaxID=2547392 RepID=UPI001EEDC7A3|nr:SDR family oxidoreductase [Seongchinamella unica]
MNRFENAAVVVTGGASGIGEATVRALVKEGAGVVIADLQRELGEALATELGDRAVFCQTDVTREVDIELAVATAVKRFGCLSGMVHCAGVVGAVGSITDTSVEAYQRTMDIHCKGALLCVKHAARVMGEGSAIVTISSTAGLLGGQGPHVYTMAKHAVIGLTRSAASELMARKIRVNAVAPGGTVTPLVNHLAGVDADTTAAVLAEQSPLGIACMPEDIAAAILYLLGPESRYVTGHTLTVDAGLTTAGWNPPPFFSQDAQLLLHAGQREDAAAD